MSLDLEAMADPIIPTADPNFHPYNCHMAVIHWALMAAGEAPQQAQDSVQKLTREYCPHCKRQNNMIASLQNHTYGKIFCKDATPLGQIPCAVGDVVIVPDIKWPSHSMVVVSIDGDIGIRGFNNTGTFAGAPFLLYDPTTRMLSNRTAPALNPVFHITQKEFVRKARNVSRLLSIHS
jgi:hypothetical protein